MAGTREQAGNDTHTSTFLASACVTMANIPLTKVKMAQEHILPTKGEEGILASQRPHLPR
jgi:regulator of PEP synthase PpsR (kinase-PPPase family)